MSELFEPAAAAPLPAVAERACKLPITAPPPPTDAERAAVPRGAAGLTALAGATLLSACGGGGGAATPAAPAPSPAPASSPSSAPLPTQVEAARFLAQAGLAATSEEMGKVTSQGYAAWLNGQFAMAPASPSTYGWLASQPDLLEMNSRLPGDFSIWRRLLSSPDVLRQRIALALSEIMVISSTLLPSARSGAVASAAYWDVLETHAFGTFRDLMEAVSLSPGMGLFLNMAGSRKADPKTGSAPDENYAREVMQLFTIGLVQLNSDGTPKLDGNGRQIYTYTQDDVTSLAALLTGWRIDLPKGVSQSDDPSFAARPMVNDPNYFSPGDKQVLGTLVPASANGPTALKMALDVLCNHPNNGPFIGRQLIQRLVCSNPSPAYVGRISAVFNNNGKGVRGDLRAVVTAILLDPEARTPPAGPANGKLREPILRFVQWARTFNLTSPDDKWRIADLSDVASRLGQSPLRAPSVFNFFAPDYVPTNSILSDNKITAPEFQICNETAIAGFLNFMQSVIPYGIGSLDSPYRTGSTAQNNPDYTVERSYASDPAALVSRYNLLLAAGRLGADTQSLIKDAVAAIPVDSANPVAGLNNRVWAAIYLVMASPDYLIQQ